MLEDDDQRGAAHFVEHLAFKGSTHVARQELVAYLRSIGVRYGADLNAETGFERTVYLLPIPTDKPDNLAQGFQVRAAARRFLTRDHYVEMVMLPGTR